MLAALALALLPIQASGLPPLPPSLAENAESQGHARNMAQDGDPLLRREAASAFLSLLQSAPPAEQFDFLLLAAGKNSFPPEVKLESSWQLLARSWDGFQEQLNQVLRKPAVGNVVALNGALNAVAALEWSDPSFVEAVAARLNEPECATSARSALFAITRHEFPDAGDFHEWWKDVRDLGREAGLAEAFDTAHSREVQLWARILKQDSSAVFEAIQSPVAGVRYLAYQAMSGLPQAIVGEESPAAEKLRTAFYQAQRQNQELELVQITRLVPHFLLGKEGMQILDVALEARYPNVRLEAARAIQRVRPADAALNGVLLHLKRLYVDNQETSLGTPEFRLALLVGFQEFAPVLAEREEDQAITVTLLRALIQEDSALVRGQIYDAIGRLGWPAFLDILRSRSLKEELAREERSSALDALTTIALGMEDRTQALDILHGLLGHPELGYRAIQGLKKLGDVASAPFLSERLTLEKESHLLKEILQAMGRIPPTSIALEALLELKPMAELRESRLVALSAQIGQGNLEPLRRSIEVLEKRKDYASMVRLLNSFPLEGFSDSEKIELESTTVRIHAEWLLLAGLGNGRAALGMDTVSRLGALQESQPAVAHWPLLLGRLEALRGNAELALKAYQQAFPLLGESLAEEVIQEIESLEKVIESQKEDLVPEPLPEPPQDEA